MAGAQQLRFEKMWDAYVDYSSNLEKLFTEEMYDSEFWMGLRQQLEVPVAKVGNFIMHQDNKDEKELFLEVQRHVFGALSRKNLLWLNNGRVPDVSDQQLTLFKALAENVYEMTAVCFADRQATHILRELETEYSELKAWLDSGLQHSACERRR